MSSRTPYTTANCITNWDLGLRKGISINLQKQINLHFGPIDATKLNSLTLNKVKS